MELHGDPCTVVLSNGNAGFVEPAGETGSLVTYKLKLTLCTIAQSLLGESLIATH